MPRKARIVDEYAIYHVICRGNNKVKVFHVGHDYWKYVTNLCKYKDLYMFELYAYALLSNHLHILIRPKCQAGLSAIMRSLSISYSVWHNRRYGCIGHVWQDRFKSRIIRDDNDLLLCMAYIEMNPVKAGLKVNPEEYKWSSCHERFRKTKDKLVDAHPLYLGLGSNDKERRRAYYDIMFRDGSQAQVPPIENRP